MKMRRSDRQTSRDVRRYLAFMLLAVVLGWLVSAAPATATHVSCGDVITQDTTLDSDLIDCPENGLIVGASDLTLNLGGHTVDGDGEGFEDVGLFVSNKSNVTITNGAVFDFEIGVRVAADFAVNDLVTNLVVGCRQSGCVSDEAFGMRVVGLGSDVLVTGNTVMNMPTGVLAGTHGSVVEENFLSHNAVGIYATGEGNRIRRNVITGSTVGMVMDSGFGNLVEENSIRGGRDGIALRDSYDNSFQRNNLDVTDRGVFLLESGRNRFERNRVRSEGVGIALSGSGGDHIVRGNFVRGPNFGISVQDSDRNLIERNRIERTNIAGIYVSSFPGGLMFDNSLVANVVRRSGGDGIFVDASAVRAVIQRNRTDRNGDDGIDVDTTEATITANRADRNGDLGIEAEPGVTDGGGNRARGNRNPLQCTGVRCR